MKDERMSKNKDGFRNELSMKDILNLPIDVSKVIIDYDDVLDVFKIKDLNNLSNKIKNIKISIHGREIGSKKEIKHLKFNDFRKLLKKLLYLPVSINNINIKIYQSQRDIMFPRDIFFGGIKTYYKNLDIRMKTSRFAFLNTYENENLVMDMPEIEINLKNIKKINKKEFKILNNASLILKK